MPCHTHAWRAGAVFVAVLAVTFSSCSRESKPPLYPIRGTVTAKGKPATKAIVVLRPVSPGAPGERIPHAEVGADGSFVVGTYADADGAPAGEYTVIITWPEARKDAKTGDEVTADSLQGRYADPAKSKWKVTVKDGDNRLEPFRLD